VTVNIDENGEAEDTSTFEYTSPEAVDAEGDNISIEILGISAMPPVSVKKGKDTFTLKVNRGLMTSDFAGDHTITVVLGDDVARDSS